MSAVGKRDGESAWIWLRDTSVHPWNSHFCDIMSILNLYSLGHLLMWFGISRYIFTNWYIFLALSIGWEILELYLPYEFAVEETANKVSDLIVNTIGFWLGIKLRNEEIEN